MRLFLGIPVSPELRDHLQQAWSGVEGPPKKWRPTPSESWHLTLAFLDEIAEDKVEALAELLAQSMEKSPKGALLVDHFETFPRKKPSYVTARATPVDPKSWKDFVDHLRDFASIMAPNIDRRPWSPHISIGKAEKNAVLQYWSKNLVEFAWIPEEFSLFRSTPTAQGSKYEILYSFPIKL